MDPNLRPTRLCLAFHGCRIAASCAVAGVAGAPGLVGAESGGAGPRIGARRGDICLSHAVAHGTGVSRLWRLLWIVPHRLDRARRDLSLQPDRTDGPI